MVRWQMATEVSAVMIFYPISLFPTATFESSEKGISPMVMDGFVPA